MVADMDAGRPAEDVATPTEEARTQVEDTPVAPAAAAALAPYEFEMEITARTLDDLPGTGVPIYLAPEFHVLNQAKTDSKGVVRVRWRGRVPTMTMVYASPRGLSAPNRVRINRFQFSSDLGVALSSYGADAIK